MNRKLDYELTQVSSDDEEFHLSYNHAGADDSQNADSKIKKVYLKGAHI